MEARPVSPRKLIAGNWKMNIAETGMLETLASAHPLPECDVLICPPATLIAGLSRGPFPVGAQDCHPEDGGAHTGDLSAGILAAAGAVAVIVGHSERRTDHAESDALVARKAAAAWRADLTAIVCVGETEAQRDSGETLRRIGAQLAGSIPDAAKDNSLVVAYEPVWAIGTGKVPTLAQIAEVHAFMRETLASRFGQRGRAVRLLYGGSVKAGNAAEIFGVAGVDGALVGGASLKAEVFGSIIAAAG
jgi:triosephosphate isomerase